MRKNVYESLLELKRKRKVVIQRYLDLPSEKQKEIIDKFANIILQKNALNEENENSKFFKKYFTETWSKTE